ncbi:hypothetical protein E5983_01155 [Streptococcus danieliae]|uniref:Uncharacterized protein n=1 Tax=Streptococcus danieliae TaxID=747656 RepID=A0A7X3G6Y7_9STRE|nr:hypothetical protein [Streptococcus danieliae]MVX58282.1 hypothetical protein [Streptococcus danieliae]
MPALSIHKYDKSNPNYVDDWISISDIGASFYGKVLTLEDYLEVENRYVQTIEKILTLFNINSLEVRELEKSFSLQFQKKTSLLNSNQCQLYQQLDNGFLLTGATISELIRFNLREAVWCRLYSPDLQIHFGYDYYMYVQSMDAETLEQCKEIIRKENLYYQEFAFSPYQMEEEDIPIFTYTWGDGQTNPPGDYHHDLRISKDDPLNRTYTEWSHFDEIGHGLAWEEYQATEQKYLQLVLEVLNFFQVTEITVSGGLGFTSVQKLGVPAHYFSPQEETLYQKIYDYRENIEDWTIESFHIQKEDFSTLFQIIFKDRLSTWIITDPLTIQFDSSYRLYLSFYGHKKEVQQLVEKQSLYWQERQPPYHETVDFS